MYLSGDGIFSFYFINVSKNLFNLLFGGIKCDLLLKLNLRSVFTSYPGIPYSLKAFLIPERAIWLTVRLPNSFLAVASSRDWFSSLDRALEFLIGNTLYGDLLLLEFYITILILGEVSAVCFPEFMQSTIFILPSYCTLLLAVSWILAGDLLVIKD